MKTGAISKVPYFDLTTQFSEVSQPWFDAIEQLGRTGNFILGPAISEFEEKIANFLGVKHAVTVSSGTDALVLALKAAGIKPQDKVIIPNFTFYASAEAIVLAGAVPKFVDIDISNFNVDPEQIKRAIDEDTKAIMPIHLFGAPAEIEEICSIANQSSLAVIEDVAQAFGARVGDQYLGSFGDTGCFSFYPTKILGAFGDGGMVTTNDDSIAQNLKLLRNHGSVQANIHSMVGTTSRLNAVQAKQLQIKLSSVHEKIERRQKLAQYYIDQLQGLEIDFPHQKSGTIHVYNIFTIRSRMRDDIVAAFQENNIGFQIYYPKLIHQQVAFENLGIREEQFPVSIQAAGEVISLPLYPEMPLSHIDRVCSVIRDALD